MPTVHKTGMDGIEPPCSGSEPDVIASIRHSKNEGYLDYFAVTYNRIP